MPSRNYTLFFVLSVGLVLVCIIFITILGQTQKKDDGTTDIRAKATVSNSLKLVGVVSDIDTSNRIVKIDQLKFDNKASEQANMGLWTVTVPSDYNISSLSTGKKVFINADASTFDITNKTMVALAISSL